MLVGLKGSGKTTTAAKLALQLRKDGATVALVGADPYRVAATEQLQTLGKQLDMPVYGMDGEKDPVADRDERPPRSESARARPPSSSTRRAARTSTRR